MEKDHIKTQEKVNKFFLSLEPSRAKNIYKKVRSDSFKRGMIIYDENNKPRLIDVAMRPWVITKKQRAFCHRLGLDMRSALAKLIEIYWQSKQAKEIIPLTPKEEEWFYLTCAKGVRHPETVFERLDALVDFESPRWKEEFKFIETNSVGVGGVHYIPTSAKISMNAVVPELKKEFPDLKLALNDDIREILLDQILSHARAIKRKRVNIAFIEDMSIPSGTAEYSYVALYSRKKGTKAFVADPRDLYLKNDEIHFKNHPIDIIYRDCEIDELLEMEKGQKESLHALRAAFCRNQVVSSFAGEFDHKSAFEIFTDERFKRYFTTAQRSIFKKHIAWTRLIFPRNTQDRRGREIDLVRFIEKNKDSLIMKPNRAYGGKDVVLGKFCSKGAWQKYLEKALREPKTAVVQELVPILKQKFPIIKENGKVALEGFYAVTGFAATPKGIAFLARYSKERVVNVSRKGGLVPVLLAK